MRPVAELLSRYLTGTSIDPFARNSKLATITNDLNPDTAAHFHLDAIDFLDLMIAQGITADVILLDPPYSLEQVKRTYEGVGRKMTQQDGQYSSYRIVKDRADVILRDNGIVIAFGWNSTGMGITRGYELIELRLICHGGRRNDTIATVERKRGVSLP